MGEYQKDAYGDASTDTPSDIPLILIPEAAIAFRRHSVPKRVQVAGNRIMDLESDLHPARAVVELGRLGISRLGTFAPRYTSCE